MDAPAVHGECKGIVLTWMLLLGSLLQLWSSCIIAGSQPSSQRQQEAVALVFLQGIKDSVSAITLFASITVGAFSAAAALKILFSNEERPVCTQSHDPYACIGHC
jgi:hypothetical protein